MDVEGCLLSTCTVIVCIFRGRSRNVEGGAHSVQTHRKKFNSGTGPAIGSTQRHLTTIHPPVVQKNFFTFIFQLSGLALIAPLCFALHC